MFGTCGVMQVYEGWGITIDREEKLAMLRRKLITKYMTLEEKGRKLLAECIAHYQVKSSMETSY